MTTAASPPHSPANIVVGKVTNSRRHSRRAHSAAHFSSTSNSASAARYAAAGFDPSRPGHYPHSHTPDYVSRDSLSSNPSRVPSLDASSPSGSTAPQHIPPSLAALPTNRFAPSHHFPPKLNTAKLATVQHHPVHSSRPFAHPDPAATPGLPSPAHGADFMLSRNPRRRPPHRIMSDLVADVGNFLRRDHARSNPRHATPRPQRRHPVEDEDEDDGPLSAREPLLSSADLVGSDDMPNESTSMPQLAVHINVIPLTPQHHHNLHAVASINDPIASDAVSPSHTPLRRSADTRPPPSRLIQRPLSPTSQVSQPVHQPSRWSADSTALPSSSVSSSPLQHYPRPLSRPLSPSHHTHDIPSAPAAAAPSYSADAIVTPLPTSRLPDPPSARSSTDALPLPNRMSADAVPGRQPLHQQSPLLHRTQSNPSATAAAHALAHTRRPRARPRPPPLITTPDSPGFSRGGAEADNSPVPLLVPLVPSTPQRTSPDPRIAPPSIPKRDETLTSLVTDPEESDLTDGATARRKPTTASVNNGSGAKTNASVDSTDNVNGKVKTKSKNRIPFDEDEPIAYSRKQITYWNTEVKGEVKGDELRRRSRDDRRKTSSRKRPSNHGQAASNVGGSGSNLPCDQNVFTLDEANDVLLSDRNVSPKLLQIEHREVQNGFIPIDIGEVTEDDFRFGPDESFTDGGFIIWRNGRIETPEKVMRKTSDGLVVEGIPTSSNNLIIVRSLDEFQESFVFKNSPNCRNNNGKTLGRGAAGRVYLAVHKPSKRKIAVKEINFYDKHKREQLRKELVTLISHQSRFLVRSYGAFHDERGRVHVTLEYMDRGSLSDVIQKVGPIPEHVICKIAEHCLRGLCFLHSNHILHRDVKTGNILLSQKLCRAKLSDFGLARDLKEGQQDVTNCDGETNSVTNTFVGTPAYMSPERLNGQKYTYASDIWALGISLIECALGRCPFDNMRSYFDYVQAVESTPAELIYGKVSKELYDLISLMTDIKAENRPKARDLLENDWILSGMGSSHLFRDWLKQLPQIDRDFDKRGQHGHGGGSSSHHHGHHGKSSHKSDYSSGNTKTYSKSSKSSSKSKDSKVRKGI